MQIYQTTTHAASAANLRTCREPAANQPRLLPTSRRAEFAQIRPTRPKGEGAYVLGPNFIARKVLKP